MSEDDQILVRTVDEKGTFLSDLKLEVGGPDVRQGIMHYIQKFGVLYHAKVSKDHWLRKFDESLHQLVMRMLDLPQEADLLHDIDFKLSLIDQSRHLQRWRFPGVIEMHHQQVFWIVGYSRLLAAGVCWPDPWEKMDFVIFVADARDFLSYDLKDVTVIKDDQQLRKLLGSGDDSDLSTTIWATFIPEETSVRFRILGIGTPPQPAKEMPLIYVEKWLNWRSQYPDNQIEIQCFAAPNTVIDTSGLWRIVDAGPSPNDLNYPSNMSGRIYNQKRSNLGPPGIFHLYHFAEHRINLAEILLWVDTEHSVFHTDDWSTIFVQNGEFNCRPMRISRR